MTSFLQFDWQEAQFYNLTEALNSLRQVLENYINREPNQPFNEIPSELLSENIETPSNLQKLCKIFGLNSIERNILLLCAGIEIDRNWRILCAKAAGEANLNYPTFDLAWKILNQTKWDATTPAAPLFKWRLIEIAQGYSLIEAPLRINKQILHYLIGCPYFDKNLAQLFELLSTEDIPSLVESHQQILEEITQIWQPQQTVLPVIQFVGNTFSSQQAMASSLCAKLGFDLYSLQAQHIPTTPNEVNQLLELIQRQALLSQFVLLLECDINTSDTALVNNLQYFIKSVKCPLIIATTDKLSIEARTILTYDVQKPSTNEQRTIWSQLLGEKSSQYQETVDNLVSQFNLTAPQIRTAYTKAINIEKKEEVERVEKAISDAQFSNILWHSCRTQSQPKLDELAQRINKSASWQDLVLNDKQMQSLRTIAAHIKGRYQVYQKWGFASKGERGLGISALFAGTSGTGKTMSAEVLANELKIDLYRIDLSTVVSKYIGETEKNLRRIFDAAEGGGAILLFDEADALFGKRSDVRDARDRYANMEVSYLLQSIEKYQGLAILTTNLRESIDEAFLRRIRFIVNYSFPDATHREKIWRRIFPKDTPTHELNYRKLGKLNVAGGNIRNIALNAAFIARHDREPVMMKHILSATQDEYTKLERLLTDVEVKGWV